QLASHTAGIRSYRGKEYALNKPYSIKDSLEVFQDDPLLFEPGTQFHYNSFGFVLLSLAMQEASGIPFEVYTQEKVLVPLGMSGAIPECPNTNDNQQAKFYTRWASGFRRAITVDNRFKIAGGGYLTTVEDILKLGKAILNKDFFPETMSLLLQSQKVAGKKTYYGLGWEVSEDTKGRVFYGHIGNQVGGYSYFRVFPETGLIIAALVNCSDPKIQDVLDGMVAELQNYGI
ncbi:MAG: serine hydrolase domain-containing protein, partial [Eudoraea sp.]|nr:serine hydrolase domain-containing protein [Eudoraea sp.]